MLGAGRGGSRAHAALLGSSPRRWLLFALLLAGGRVCLAQDPPPPPPPPQTCDNVGTPNCNDHGKCTPTEKGGTCQCDGKWGGDTCTVDPCKNGGNTDCGSHGTCQVKDDGHTCKCHGEWTGNECNKQPCDGEGNDNCGSHGTCQNKGDGHECKCHGEWGGGTCTVDPCKNGGNADCGTNGDCQVKGNGHTCKCHGEWTGNTCKTPPCATEDDCGTHGDCATKGDGHECKCHGEWGGAKCDKDPCTHVGNANCGTHGTCHNTGNFHTCTCNDDYESPSTDPPCSKKPCDASKPVTHGNPQGGIDYHGDCSAHMHHGDECTPGCDNGYQATGPRKCMDGQVTPMSCAKRTCPAAPATGHECPGGGECNGRNDKGSGSCAAEDKLKLGETCTATCNAPGYTKSGKLGGGTQQVFTCSVRGTNDMYYPESLTCIGIPCTTDVPAHAHIDYGTTDRGRFPGTDVEFSCDDGWFMHAGGEKKNQCTAATGKYPTPTCDACDNVGHCPGEDRYLLHGDPSGGKPRGQGKPGRRCNCPDLSKGCEKPTSYCCNKPDCANADGGRSCYPGWTKDVSCTAITCASSTVNVNGWQGVTLEGSGVQLTQDLVATIPPDCDGKSFPEECPVTCKTGYTYSNKAYKAITPVPQATYTCLPKSSDHLAPTGEWWALTKDGVPDTQPTGLATTDTNPWKGPLHPRDMQNVPNQFLDTQTNDLQCRAVECNNLMSLKVKFDRSKWEHHRPGSANDTFDPRQAYDDDETKTPICKEVTVDQLCGTGNRTQTLTVLQLKVRSAACGCDDPASATCTTHKALKGLCEVECLPSFYPDPAVSNSTAISSKIINGRVQYTCMPPETGDGIDQAVGRWDTTAQLVCKQGELAPKKSEWLTHMKSQTHPALPFRDSVHLLKYPINNQPRSNLCDTHAELCCCGSWLGWDLALGKGPKFQWAFQAKDTHGLARNYDTLDNSNDVNGDSGRLYDFVSVMVTRVPQRYFSVTDDNNAVLSGKLQPRVDADHFQHTGPCMGKITVNDGRTTPLLEGDCTRYNAMTTTSEESKQQAVGPERFTVRYPTTAHQVNGTWVIDSKEFEQHGVYYISVYLCTSANGDACKITATQNSDGTASYTLPDPKYLIPGTGLPEKDEMPSSAFTVCPQNTAVDEQSPSDEIVSGALLHRCLAKSGFYSPRGPGHVAEKCKDGFDCHLSGMTWPVALPRFWVDVEGKQGSSPKMSACTTLGACPGSNMFGAKCTKWKPDDTEYSQEYDFNVTKNLRQNECYSKEQDFKKDQTIDGKLYVGGPIVKASCRQAVGYRCCPGNKGKKCQECCTQDDSGANHSKSAASANCDGRQWHAETTGAGKQCFPCPPTDINPWLIVLGVIALLVFLRLASSAAKLVKHGSAASGPMLSVMNFVQAADLFQGLKWQWPPEFTAFCRQIASLFNFNISGFLRLLHLPKLGMPIPECAFKFKYMEKWYLIMMSPIILVLILVTMAGVKVLFKVLKIKFQLAVQRWQHSRCAHYLRRLNFPAAERDSGQPLLSDPLHSLAAGSASDSVSGKQMVDMAAAVAEQQLLGDSQRVSGQAAAMAAANPSDALDPTWGEVWEWHTNNQGWKPFSAEEQMILKSASTAGRRTVNLQRGPFTYEIDLKYREQINITVDEKTGEPTKGNGRKRKLRINIPGHAFRTAWADKAYWQGVRLAVQKVLLLYLMVGYVNLAGTALEPLACSKDLDGKGFITAAPSIGCDWCETDSDIQLTTYKTLATWATICYTLYGLGTPILFFMILYYHQNHKRGLKTKRFTDAYGFLSTKMDEEYYWWECAISVRKLLLVSFTKWSGMGGSATSDGALLPCTLMNLFISIAAFGTQAWCTPFANRDANEAETLMLLATILILVLGLGQKAQDGSVLDFEAKTEANNFLKIMKYIIYGAMIAFGAYTLWIVVRRLKGAAFNVWHQRKFTAAENDGRIIKDRVAKMLHKSKMSVATAWAAIKAQKVRSKSMGDIERMERIFKKIKYFQEKTEMTLPMKRFNQWEEFFPKDLRPAMYAWAPTAPLSEANDLVWFMRQLHKMEMRQHRILYTITRADCKEFWMWTLSYFLCCFKAKARDAETDSGDEDSDDEFSAGTNEPQLPMSERGSFANPYLRDLFKEAGRQDDLTAAERVLSRPTLPASMRKRGSKRGFIQQPSTHGSQIDSQQNFGVEHSPYMSVRLEPEPEPEPQAGIEDGQASSDESDDSGSDEENVTIRSTDSAGALPDENLRQSQRWFNLQVKEQEEADERRKKASWGYKVGNKWKTLVNQAKMTFFSTTRRMIWSSLGALITYGWTVFCLVRLYAVEFIANDITTADFDSEHYAKCQNDDNQDEPLWIGMLAGYWALLALWPLAAYGLSTWRKRQGISAASADRKFSSTSAYQSRSTLGLFFRPSRPNWDFIDSGQIPIEAQFAAGMGAE